MSKTETTEKEVATKAPAKTTRKAPVKKPVSMPIHEALVHIQTTLNAPKNLRNSFGNYNYRSAETILEALKPLLKETNTRLNISDKVLLVGDRYYIEATVTLTDSTGEFVTSTAQAREEEAKKGMDSGQVSGSTGSYARKYALNGMFAIDDSKDLDSDEFQKEATSPTAHQAVEPKKPWLNESDTESFNKVVAYLQNGGSLDDVKGKWAIARALEKKLLELAKQ